MLTCAPAAVCDCNHRAGVSASPEARDPYQQEMLGHTRCYGSINRNCPPANYGGANLRTNGRWYSQVQLILQLHLPGGRRWTIYNQRTLYRRNSRG